MNFDANTIATLMQLLNPDKQVGNAVPVNLAKDIGVQIAKVLKEV